MVHFCVSFLYCIKYSIRTLICQELFYLDEFRLNFSMPQKATRERNKIVSQFGD
nr:MAG TPA: hypothetical protein [Bacteriophage sp.]